MTAAVVTDCENGLRLSFGLIDKEEIAQNDHFSIFRYTTYIHCQQICLVLSTQHRALMEFAVRKRNVNVVES